MLIPKKAHPSGLILPQSVQEDSSIWTPKKDLLFRIGKYRDLIANNDPIRVDFQIGNYIQLEIVNTTDGRSRMVTPEFHNNITNVGMDMCATDNNRIYYCHVGTGSGPVADSNTTLTSWLASCNWNVGLSGQISHTVNAASPYQAEMYHRWDFPTGAVVGNISEIGFGPLSTNGSNLFCRELVRDEAGNPTTITITALEALRVHYKFRLYPPLVDVTGTINGTISGGAASRNFTRRAWRVGNTGTWGAKYPSTPPALYNYGSLGYIYTGNNALTAINAINTTGLTLNSGATTNSYTPGSYTRTGQVTMTPTQNNGDIKRVTWECMNNSGSVSLGNAGFQIEFDTVITKTNVQSLTFTFTTTWSRYA